MPLFDYTGQLQSGSVFQGTLEADSPGRAEAILADMGVRVTALRPARRQAYVAPLSLDDFLFFNEQVASMTRAGVPLHDGLRTLAADVASRKLKRLLLDLVAELEAGTPLEQALAKLDARFPTRYASVVQAGLATGDLGGTLYGLTTHLRLKSDTRRALVELAAYPLIILAFAFGIVVFLMRVVVPEFESMALDMLGMPEGVALAVGPPAMPYLTGLLFSAAHAWPEIEIALLALVGLVVVLTAATYLPGGRPVREWFLRRIPGVAQVYWSSVLARFAHTSALAAFSRRPLPELIAASGAASGSLSLARTAERVGRKLSQGLSLEEAAQGERDIPALWTCVVGVTAARGELAPALEELARTYELRARQWAATVRLVLGPFLLLLVALVLGTVVSGIALAVVHLIRSLTAYAP